VTDFLGTPCTVVGVEVVTVMGVLNLNSMIQNNDFASLNSNVMIRKMILSEDGLSANNTKYILYFYDIIIFIIS